MYVQLLLYVYLSICMHLGAQTMGPCKVRNETETKRNETKQIGTKRNKSKRNETDQNETKRNKSKRNEKMIWQAIVDKNQYFLSLILENHYLILETDLLIEENEFQI